MRSYREIDAEGIPSYSSQETPDSDSVKVGTISTIRSQKVQHYSSLIVGTAFAKAITYNARITEPNGYAAIRASLSLTIVIEPVLSLGHTAQLMMDGAAIRAISGSGTIKLDNLDRGTHQFQIRIKRADGKTIFDGPSTTISLLRSSILH